MPNQEYCFKDNWHFWLFCKFLRKFPKSSVSMFTTWKLNTGLGKGKFTYTLTWVEYMINASQYPCVKILASKVKLLKAVGTLRLRPKGLWSLRTCFEGECVSWPLFISLLDVRWAVRCPLWCTSLTQTQGEALIDHRLTLQHRTKTNPFSLYIDHIKITCTATEHWLAQYEIRSLCVWAWTFYSLIPKPVGVDLQLLLSTHSKTLSLSSDR